MRALALEIKVESLWAIVKIREILKQIIRGADSAVRLLSLHNSNVFERMTDVAAFQTFCKLCYDIIIPLYMSPVFVPKFCGGEKTQQHQRRLEDESVFLLGLSAVSHSTTLPANNLSGPRFFGLYLQTVYKSPITHILGCLRVEHEMFL